MIKQEKELIVDKIMEIGGKIHSLITSDNQEIAYEIINELRELQSKIFNL